MPADITFALLSSSQAQLGNVFGKKKKQTTTLIIGKGHDLNDIKIGSQLTTVIRIEDLLAQFRKGLRANKQKEKENDDNIISDNK